jgi:predicted nucleic acid-binding protein
VILDTNAVSAFAEGDPAALLQIEAAEELHLPVVVLGEYHFGIASSRRRREYERWLARGRAFWELLPIVEETAMYYSSIRQELRKAGTPIPANDAWIAALVRQHALPLLSRDEHFDAVKGVVRIAW